MWKDALELLGEMRDRGVTPDVFCFNAALDSISKRIMNKHNIFEGVLPDPDEIENFMRHIMKLLDWMDRDCIVKGE